jgi:glc operon protein GlcG
MQTVRHLGEAEAAIAVEACRAELKRRGKSAVIVVSDGNGELLALWRADGCNEPTVVIAQNKAYTAARSRTPSGDLGRHAQAGGFPLQYLGDSRYVGWDGGAPVIHQDECLGAVAVSGLSGDEDLDICRIGVNAILSALA